MTEIDHYSILGVTPNCSNDAIKKAYRDMARKFHPDKNPSPDANAHFLNIKKAYDILSSPSERRTYDASRPRQARPRPPHKGDRVFTHTNNRQNPYSRPQKPASHFRSSENYHFTPPPDSYARGFNGWSEHNGKWEYKEQPEGEPVYREFMNRMKRNNNESERMRRKTFFAAFDEEERERANDLFRRGQNIRAILVLTWETYHRVNTDRLKSELGAENLFVSQGGGKMVSTVDFLKVAEALKAISLLQRHYPSISFRWRKGKPETLDISDSENESDIIELSDDEDEVKEVPISGQNKFGHRRRRPADPVEIESSEDESLDEELIEEDLNRPGSSDFDPENDIVSDEEFEVVDEFNAANEPFSEARQPPPKEDFREAQPNGCCNGQSATYVIPDSEDEFNSSDEERLASPRHPFNHDEENGDEADDEGEFKPMRFVIRPRSQIPASNPEVILLDD